MNTDHDQEHNNQIDLTLPTLNATQQFGNLLGRSLPAGSILLLNGDLGSGKTTLVNAIGSGLGIADTIISPTFVLVNEYDDGRIPLYHFDLYRLTPSATQEFVIDHYWDDMEYEPGIIAIEWAERLSDRPPYALTIHLSMTPLGPSNSSERSRVENSSGASDHQRYAMLTLEGHWKPNIAPCWEELKRFEKTQPSYCL